MSDIGRKQNQSASGRAPQLDQYAGLWGFSRRVLISASLLLAAFVVFLALCERWEGHAFNLGACALLAAYCILRWIIRPRNTRERALFTVVLAVLFCGILLHNHYERTADLYGRLKIRTWNIYHYYIGSKYFDELGFDDLYVQTIVADRQDTNRLKRVTSIRDMADYNVKPVDRLVPAERSERFTDGRWREFKRDLRALLPRTSRRTWSSILLDRGYNPTPFYNTVVSAVSHRIDFHKRRQVLLATHIDFALYIIMFAAVAWAFGFEPAMLVFLAFALLPFNPGRLVGGYVQYDWMAAIVLGVCFLKKRMPIASGISMGYAVMARVFPLILAAGLAAPALLRSIRTRKPDRTGLRFGIAIALFCVLGVGVGCMSQRGFSAWTEWKGNIGVHNEHMTYGEGRVGLKHIFTHKLGEQQRFESFNQRKQTLRQQRIPYFISAAVVLLLLLATIWFQRDVNSVILAMVAVYAILVPSHYYWSILALLPLWLIADEDKPWQPALIPCLTAFIVPAGWYLYAMDQSIHYARYIRFDWILGVCFLIWLIVLLIKALPGIRSLFHHKK